MITWPQQQTLIVSITTMAHSLLKLLSLLCAIQVNCLTINPQIARGSDKQVRPSCFFASPLQITIVLPRTATTQAPTTTTEDYDYEDGDGDEDDEDADEELRLRRRRLRNKRKKRIKTKKPKTKTTRNPKKNKRRPRKKNPVLFD